MEAKEQEVLHGSARRIIPDHGSGLHVRHRAALYKSGYGHSQELEAYTVVRIREFRTFLQGYAKGC